MRIGAIDMHRATVRIADRTAQAFFEIGLERCQNRAIQPIEVRRHQRAVMRGPVRIGVDGDGLDVVAGLRASGQRLWIIMMTGRGEIEECVSALGRGADHYLVKPVRLEVLAATVETLVRRMDGLSDRQR